LITWLDQKTSKYYSYKSGISARDLRVLCSFSLGD
jgi:hypothetical protein